MMRSGDSCLTSLVARPALLLLAVGCAGGLSRAGSAYEKSYLQADHNWAFRAGYRDADRLFNGFDYGHAILYEMLWRHPDTPGQALDRDQFDLITTRILAHPPRLPLEESAIAPAWAKLAPEALEMFEWSHMLHRQIFDVWADERIPDVRKDAEVARVVAYYRERRALAFSAQPKSMALMEGQPYSLAFRQRCPKFNGLLWSYHWFQMTVYDAMMAGGTESERKANVRASMDRFWAMVHGGVDSMPRVMPMSPAIAPRFSSRYPEAAAIFDNMHAMHDVVSDILANANVPRGDKRRRILEAVARYRDDTTEVTSVDEWRSMALDMGAERMGGVAFPVPRP